MAIFVPDFYKMEKFDEIYLLLTGQYGIAGLVLIGVVLLFFAIQLCYWLGSYGKLPRFRNRRMDEPRTVDGISVIVILGDDFLFLEKTLPRIMGQQYDNFELVIVELGTTPEFRDELDIQRTRYQNLVTTRLNDDPRFHISNKMAYNVGIKAAKYGSIILTTADAMPVSDKWLECIAKGFACGEVVLGYCGLVRSRGFADKMMRCSRLMQSVRYLASAVAGKPYRGILQNLGFSKQLYFDSRGFNHLDMNIGEDDLFVQKITAGRDTIVVMNPHATLRQEVWGGLGTWFRLRKILGTTRRYYPAWARRKVVAEPVSRVLFLISVIVAASLLPTYSAMGAGALWLIRTAVMRHQVKRIAKRLGERGLGWAIILHDIEEPFGSAAISLARRIKPMPEVWK